MISYLRSSLIVFLVFAQICQTLGTDILDAETRDMISKNCKTDALVSFAKCCDDIRDDTKQLIFNEKKEWTDWLLSHTCCQYYGLIGCFNETKSESNCDANKIDPFLAKRFHISEVEKRCSVFGGALGF